MTDEDVAALLDSLEPLAVIEAPAGCGKTYQGANFARRCAAASSRGRTLILTHTHSACSQFAKETKATASKIEIKTIDSLVVQIATIYHKSLDLPPDPSAWARQQDADGFQELGSRIAMLLAAKPMIAAALVDRYPVIVADEHQDSCAEQHGIVMSLHAAGSRLRIFGDPMQAIYERTANGIATNRARWEGLKSSGSFAELNCAHRWKDGSLELGQWILQTRERLKNGDAVDLTDVLPAGLKVHFADNIANQKSGYRLSPAHRQPIDEVVNTAGSMLILSGQNSTVDALRAHWNRRFPIWEGHTRGPLGKLVTALAGNAQNRVVVAEATVSFIEDLCKGFTRSSHGDRLIAEVASACTKSTTGKPARIQELARFILNEPDHFGVAKCLARFHELVESKADGFKDVCIDYRNEFRDAIKVGRFGEPEEGIAEIHRRRSFARPMPPPKSISTIHKAKGLECDHALIIPCDKQHFSSTAYSRCKLYVALSRARRSLTLVLSRTSPSPLFKAAGDS